MTDPLTRIEEANSQRDVGRMVARIYAGALEETGSRRAAFWTTVAYTAGLIHGAPPPTDEDSAT